jgi:hypothetical protein
MKNYESSEEASSPTEKTCDFTLPHAIFLLFFPFLSHFSQKNQFCLPGFGFRFGTETLLETRKEAKTIAEELRSYFLVVPDTAPCCADTA